MPADQPLSTVVIATYNGARYVDTTLRSALEQTLRDFEILVVDDGSTDDTVGHVRAFSDPRLRLLERTHGGAPAAWNAAVEVAGGHFIALLDHDDLWTPTKLEGHLKSFKANPTAQATFSWSGSIDEHGRRIEIHPKRWHGPISF